MFAVRPVLGRTIALGMVVALAPLSCAGGYSGAAAPAVVSGSQAASMRAYYCGAHWENEARLAVADRNTATWLTVLGGTALTTSAGLLIGSTDSDHAKDFRTAGYITAVAGGALLGTGIGLLVKAGGRDDAAKTAAVRGAAMFAAIDRYEAANASSKKAGAPDPKLGADLDETTNRLFRDCLGLQSDPSDTAGENAADAGEKATGASEKAQAAGDRAPAEGGKAATASPADKKESVAAANESVTAGKTSVAAPDTKAPPASDAKAQPESKVH